MQFRVKLPVDPPKTPNGKLGGPISTFQLYPAFWLSMILCDKDGLHRAEACHRAARRVLGVPVGELVRSELVMDHSAALAASEQ